MKKNKVAINAIAVLLLTISSASGNQILTIDDASGNLGTVDVQTGIAHVIGNTGVSLTDIAFSPTGSLIRNIVYKSVYDQHRNRGAHFDRPTFDTECKCVGFRRGRNTVCCGSRGCLPLHC